MYIELYFCCGSICERDLKFSGRDECPLQLFKLAASVYFHFTVMLSMPSVNKCPGIGNPDVTLDFKASQMNGSVQCLIIYTGKN